jgi:hypothetical protein
LFQKKEDSDSLFDESGFWPDKECTDNCTDTADKCKNAENVRQVRGSDPDTSKKGDNATKEINNLLITKKTKKSMRIFYSPSEGIHLQAS